MQQNKLLFKIYAGILLVIIGLIVLHAPLTVWLSSHFPDHELIYKAWKEILLILALPLGVWLAVKTGLAKQMWQDKLFLAIAGFAALHFLLLLIFRPSFNPAIAGLMIDLRYLLFFVLVYICIKLEPRYRHIFLQAIFVGAVIVLGFAILQIFILPNDILAHIGYGKATIEPYLTVDKNPAFIRINSTLRGPNPLGAYALIWLSLTLAYLIKTKKWQRSFQPKLLGALAIITGLIVLWSSYSRSAILGSLVSLAVLIEVTFWRKLYARKWLVAASILVVLVIGSFSLSRNDSFFQQVVLHNNLQGGSKIDSTEAHASSLENGAKKVIHQPLGSGIGSTGSASLLGGQPVILENQYLFIAHESGWFGLALFLFIFVEVLRRLWCGRRDYLALGIFASGIGLGVVGLLLPVWADDTIGIIWWGLAAVALAVTKGKHGSTKQKTARTSKLH